MAKQQFAEAVWEADESSGLNSNVHSHEVQVNLTGLFPALDGNALTVHIPALQWEGSIISESFLNALKVAGLNELIVDSLIDEFMTGVQTQMLAKLFATRVVSRTGI